VLDGIFKKYLRINLKKELLIYKLIATDLFEFL
jgi:hypothetical protein